MLRDYADIIERLGAPWWYDGNGTPRYCDFHPDRCDVYNDYVVLARIGCQACQWEGLVACEWSKYDHLDNLAAGMAPKMPDLATADAGSFYYGDPPPHDGCISGSTMSSNLLMIVEFWGRGRPAFAWSRINKYEGAYESKEE